MAIYQVRLTLLALAALGTAAFVIAAAIVVHGGQVAYAEQVRKRCMRALAATSSWQADAVETETGSDGKKSVVRTRYLVRRPGEYRLMMTEPDAGGRDVVSTTIRTKSALYTRRVNADGTSELHIVNGVRPALGIEFDTTLGQTMKSVSEARPLKIVGRESYNGRLADKIELSPGTFVLIDRDSGLPLSEQTVSGDTAAHAIEFSNLEADVPTEEREFDPASLGRADRTVVEDLGFRPVSDAAKSARAIGFTPLSVPAPAGYSLEVQGYVDPAVPNGESAAEPAFVSAFASGPNGVIVTQVHRSGLGDSVQCFGNPGTGGSAVIDLGGHPALLYSEDSKMQLTFARNDVLVTIEGVLDRLAMEELAKRIR